MHSENLKKKRKISLSKILIMNVKAIYITGCCVKDQLV